jgi:hypothetical protein
MDTIAYHVGDQVMLNMKNYKTGCLTHKLEPRWERPFTVLKASSHEVTLQLLVNMKIFNTFHVSIIRLYRVNSILGQSETNDDMRANRGWEVVRTDDSIETEEWRFVKVMDCEKANNG